MFMIDVMFHENGTMFVLESLIMSIGLKFSVVCLLGKRLCVRELP